MQAESSQTLVIVSWPMLLGLGWVIAGSLLAYGRLKRRSRFSQIGLALVGLMTLATPLAWYLYAATRPDLYPIGVGDVLVLASLAFAGGAILLSGVVLPKGMLAGPAKR